MKAGYKKMNLRTEVLGSPMLDDRNGVGLQIKRTVDTRVCWLGVQQSACIEH